MPLTCWGTAGVACGAGALNIDVGSTAGVGAGALNIDVGSTAGVGAGALNIVAGFTAGVGAGAAGALCIVDGAGGGGGGGGGNGALVIDAGLTAGCCGAWALNIDVGSTAGCAAGALVIDAGSGIIACVRGSATVNGLRPLNPRGITVVRAVAPDCDAGI